MERTNRHGATMNGRPLHQDDPLEEALEAQAPAITRITSERMPDGVRRSTYRVVGAPIDPAWKVRSGHEPWCEITTWGEREARTIGSFGGELWLSLIHI